MAPGAIGTNLRAAGSNDPPCMARLVLISGGAAGSGYPLVEGLNRIGRAPGNEVRVEGPTISAAHCEIWWMKERVLVRDLGSTNGTYVNGRTITETELPPGGTLSVGGMEFVVEGIAGHGLVGIGQGVEPGPRLPPPPRFTPGGDPSCVNHPETPALFRCPKCGEQFCGDCIRILGRRGGRQHAYCSLCHAECVAVHPAGGAVPAAGGWLSKLTQTLRLGRK